MSQATESMLDDGAKTPAKRAWAMRGWPETAMPSGLRFAVCPIGIAVSVFILAELAHFADSESTGPIHDALAWVGAFALAAPLTCAAAKLWIYMWPTRVTRSLPDAHPSNGTTPPLC